MERKIHGCNKHLNLLGAMWLTDWVMRSPHNVLFPSPHKYLGENKTLWFMFPLFFLPAWVRGIYCLQATLGVEWALGGWLQPHFIKNFLCDFYNYVIFSVIICHLFPLGFHFLIWKMMKINSKLPLNSKLYVSKGKLRGDSYFKNPISSLHPVI